MVDIQALRDKLVRMLRYFVTIEPEDGAQIILLRFAVMSRFDWPDAYLFTASHNMAYDQRKRARPLPLIEDDTANHGVVGTPLWDEASRMTLGKEGRRLASLPLTPEDAEWLLDFYDRKSRGERLSGRDRQRALRLRRSARGDRGDRGV